MNVVDPHLTKCSESKQKKKNKLVIVFAYFVDSKQNIKLSYYINNF